MSEEVKKVEETKDEMTYYEIQMLVGMASDAQRHILIYGLKKTLLNKYIDDIIGKSLVTNSQVKKRRAFKRNNNQENDDNNISSIIDELNSKIEQACKKLKIGDSSPYKLDQDKYRDRIKAISTSTTSIEEEEFSKIASKIQLLEKSYDNEWTTTTEDKEKGTETKTTINPPAECKNITEEVFIGELYNRISSNKLVEISLDDNGKVIDENKLMDYIIYLSESSENHERRKFKYIIEYINQNIEVIEGLDKDIYGKIMQQLNSKNTPITEYTDDKLSVEETFYLSNIARQAVKKIEKDIKAIKQRRLEPAEEKVEETIDPVKEFREKLEGSWIKPLLNMEFISMAKSCDLEQYIKQITYESMLENIKIEGKIDFEVFENAAIEIIKQKIIKLKPELEKFINTFGIKETDSRTRICKELGYDAGGDDLKKAIEDFEAEKAKATIEQEKQKNVKLSELQKTKKFVKSAIEQLKSIKNKPIEGVEITDEIRNKIESLPDEIDDKNIDYIIENLDNISAELFSKLNEKLEKVNQQIDGTNVPGDIKKTATIANAATILLLSPTSRQQMIEIRICFIEERILELEEYIQKRKTENTVKFDEAEYNIEIESDRQNLFNALMENSKQLKSLDNESIKTIAEKLNSLKNGNTTKEEIEDLINLITKLHIQASLPQPPKEKADE